MLEYSMITKERLEQNEIISRLFLIKVYFEFETKEKFLFKYLSFL